MAIGGEPAKGELRGILANIDAHLEHLSERMDQFHMDILAAIRSRSGSLARGSLAHGSRPSSTSFSPWRGSAMKKEVGQMIPSDRVEPKATVTIMDSAGSAADTPQRDDPMSSGGLVSPLESRASVMQGQTSVIPLPSNATFEKRRNPKLGKSVDLKVAWQLQAEEALANNGASSAVHPMIRLVRRTWAERVWETLSDPNSSRLAWAISWALQLLVLLSVSLDYAALIDKANSRMDGTALLVFNIMVDVFFFAEVLLRLVATPSKANYIKDPLNWADLLAACALPFRFVALVTTSEGLEMGLCLILPLVRFLKLLRYFEVFRLLIVAFHNSIEALPVLSYFMAVLVLFSATGIYMAEGNNIPSIQHSIWLAVVTMTTVGFGDYVPRSTGGYIIVSVLTLVSVWFLALPVGIIGHEFTCSWKARNHVLLITRTKNCLEKWGYNSNSLSMLCQYVDSNGDGSLNMPEFLELMRQMRIGIDAKMAMELFQEFDDDGSGWIEYDEFLRHIYPEDFVRSQFTSENHRKSCAGVSAAMQRLEKHVEQHQSNQ